jgi:elongation factor G
MGADFAYEEIPLHLKEKAQEYREQLVEASVEQDDSLMEKYLSGEEITEEELKKCIRKATITGAFVPVLNVTKVTSLFLMDSFKCGFVVDVS